MNRKLILTALIGLICNLGYAQDEIVAESPATDSTDALDNTAAAADNLDFETIDVDGQARPRATTPAPRPRLTQADRMKSLRDRMEKRTADLVLRKIEKNRIEMEMQMMKKINLAMEQQLNANLKAME